MKRIILFSLYITICNCRLIAQDVVPVPEDMLRIVWNKPSGTARNQALGGVNVALGGDLTSLFVNPAGLGLYNTKEVVITGGALSYKGDASYFNNRYSTNVLNTFNFGTTGFVTPVGKDNECINFAIAINKTADFNSYYHYEGNNPYTSFTDNPTRIFHNYISNHGSSNAADILYDGMDDPSLYYVTRLGLNSHLISINQDPGNGTLYGFSRAADVLDLDKSYLHQINDIKTNGGIIEPSIGFATNANGVSFGASIGIPIVDYGRSRTYTEADGSGLADNYFNSFTYNENFSTLGVGGNAKLGIIFTLPKRLKIGLAFHTPTIYVLTNKVDASITTDVENYDPAQPVFKSTTTKLYDKKPLTSKYQLNSDFKFMMGLTYMFTENPDVKKQRGFISADIEYGNPRFTNFRRSDDGLSDNFLDDINNEISNTYKAFLTTRVGCELKFNPIMIRGGFSYTTNPYSKTTGLNSTMLNWSGGLGYRNRGMFIDVSYSTSVIKGVDFPYYTNGSNYYAETTNNTVSILMTVGFKF